MKDFKLVSTLVSFNLKTDPWKIRTGTPEISRRTQLWLFEQGIDWGFGDGSVQNYNEYFLTNCVADSSEGSEYMMHGPESNFKNKQATEIKLEFETIIKSVTLIPSMLTQAPKKTESEIQLEELLKQISELNTQATKLQEIINVKA